MTNDQKTAFLGTPGFVQDPGRFGNADLLKAVGANSGNLLFQYAATRLIGGTLEHVGFSGKGYGDATVFRGLDFFVFPAANHLKADGEWDLLTKFLKSIRVPLIILGLGAQADRGADPKATAASIRENQSVMDFVQMLKDKAQLITVRGPFTEAVCHELGLSAVLRLGCQSQFLNADRDLGAATATRLSELANSDAPARLARLALTASAPNELHGWRAELEEKLFGWTAESDGIYLQQSCEEWFFDGAEGHLADLSSSNLAYAHRHIAPHMERKAFAEKLKATFRIYFDARRWIDDLAPVDLAIGTRIHGNMAALAASRPGVLVVHDARVTELAEEMHVPRVDGQSVIDATDHRQVLKSVEFDGAAFDATRRRKAGMLADAFSKLGVPPSDHLRHLAA
ncbi:polysaccharide pyruvyl transferase family protein [Mesorhizobium sp. CAU 1732]|uniref:polysaccharide pyruvyl transferase family protein n=1 Tax=Mesorhizobium sp. CAU 1732 TaxID=3140358 RepID=UPI00325FF076